MSSLRQRLLTIPRTSSAAPSRRYASSNLKVPPKLNDLSQKAASLATQYGAKLPELSGKLGKRMNGLLGSYSEPLAHNYQFTKEVLKQVYMKENLAPPKVEQVKAAYRELAANASSLLFWRQALESGDWKRLAVYGIEAVGLFSIGEMIGRRHIVGYKLD
ncbi:hypothetical protein PCANC_04093 [Puccinia coronata f. sp. avenae]|uniref:ATP synthase subunit n=1 Tax=Puccinia coronata f. sp. avenae TaxID=200324 RepID=A0A2N5W210_9BASI|nr:hypothetical protein PCANC_04093 [Puccinia coronata f. sp. avenae]